MKEFIKTVLNIIWILFTGIEMAVAFIAIGVLMCATIIGIPFGLQCFKFAQLAIFAKTHTVNTNFYDNIALNVLWIIVCGWIFALMFVFLGVVWCLTVIGIGKGKICFKFAKLSLMPFGSEISYKYSEKQN